MATDNNHRPPPGRIVDQSPGDEIRARRAELGLTRARLASLAGCSISMLGVLEAGHTPRRSDVVDRVLSALDAQEAA